MNENLNNALAEVARSLGIEVNQLWNYLSDEGFIQYTQVMAFKYGVYTFVSILFLIIGIILFIITIRKFYKILGENRYFDGDAYDCLLFVALMLIFIFLVTIIICLPKFLGWMYAPQGMVIDMFVSKL